MRAKSTKRTPAAAADAVRLVAEIASLQERRAELLARLAAEVREMDIAIARATDALGFEVRNARIAPADMAAAVRGIVGGACVMAGQMCTAISRVLVHESVAADFSQQLTQALAQVKVGPGKLPTSAMGPLIDQRT